MRSIKPSSSPFFPPFKRVIITKDDHLREFVRLNVDKYAAISEPEMIFDFTLFIYN